MMSDTLVETISLRNKLKLEIWDVSRILAGDRWLLRLEARISVPLKTEFFDAIPEKEKFFPVLEKVFGSEIPYCHVEEKHFVDPNEKEESFQQCLGYLKNNLLPYLNHPDFLRRFVLSRYRALREKNPELFESD
ncbi:MAG: hypothetical protein PVG99_11485 [Desulfobacteraceae bacterium]|jgi:hypothetical protein